MKRYFNLLLVFVLFLASCKQAKGPSEANKDAQPTTTSTTTSMKVPDWVVNANIYEVNLRQYTKQGTIRAFEAHLPRLKEMGVDILWFMPIYPISKTNRKGALGSYYAISDYTAVNPEHGTMDDFKALVKKAHEMGMKVILDWVPNHTGWDHKWIKGHPDWYTKDPKTGEIIPPNPDWTDVADLNYNNPDMRKQMIADMQFWLRDVDVDGFRCDVAGEVPGDFWVQARPELEKIKPVFMLAEDEDHPEFFNTCFQANYAWAFKGVMLNIVEGKANASAVDTLLAKYRQENPPQAIKMFFIINHDENSWHDFPKVLGNAEDAFAVLAFTMSGMPLIYSGQEAGALQRKLAFFDKDEIDWGNYEKQEFYKSLLALKHNNKALWNGTSGGKLEKIETGKDDKVFAFSREKDGDKVEVFVNLSGQSQTFTPQGDFFAGNFDNVLQKSSMMLVEGESLVLQPWGYLVLSKTN
jgi:alpha-amylase